VQKELPKVDPLTVPEEPEEDPESHIAQVPACISAIPKDGLKVKSTGMSKLDIAYETGTLTDTKGVQKSCITDLTVKQFECREFDFVPAWGIMIGPQMEIPTTVKVEHGQKVISVPLSDIYDFRALDTKGLPRFVLSTYSHYVIVQPVGLTTMPLAKRNAKLVRSCQEHYETLRMNSPTGPRIDADYSAGFVKRMTKFFEGLERVGSIRRRKGFLVPACPKHRRTGAYNSNTRKFTCTKCGADLGGAGKPPAQVEDED